jgi:hypothetical protein
MTIIPKSNEVRIWKSSLIYVPQWDIRFEAKSMNYTRRILPASGTIVVDEIQRRKFDHFMENFEWLAKQARKFWARKGEDLSKTEIYDTRQKL